MKPQQRKRSIAPALDGEAVRGEHRHEAACEHEQRREHQLELGQRVRGAERGVREKERKRRPEQPKEQHLTPEKPLEALSVLVHLRCYRHNPPQT